MSTYMNGQDALFQVDEGISDTDDTAKSIPSISSLRRQVGYGSAVGKRKRDEEEEEEGDMNETIEQLSKRVKDNVQFTGYRQESADARNSTDEQKLLLRYECIQFNYST